MPALSGSPSYGFSGLLHAGVLAWLMLSTPSEPEARETVYDQMIRPHEDRIIWYRPQDRLPDISPSLASNGNSRPRASEHFDQTIVAGPKDGSRSRQMIWMPTPEVSMPKPAPLPNVLAVAPKPARPFIPPPPGPRPPIEKPRLPEVPAASLATSTSAALDTGSRRPPPKSFDPPPAKITSDAARTMPEAPAVSLAPSTSAALDIDTRRAPPKSWSPPPAKNTPANRRDIPEAPAASLVPSTSAALDFGNRRAPPKSFNPPPSRPTPATRRTMPEAPAASLAPATSAALDIDPRRAPPKSWTPPPAKNASAAGRTMPEELAASLAAPSSLPLDLISRRAPPRQWSPPPTPSAGIPPGPLADAPEISPSADRHVDASFAIVGLNPAKAPDFTPPSGSAPAGFSGGPEVRPDDQAKTNQSTSLVIPGLLTRGGPKESQPTMIAGVLPIPRRDIAAAIRAITELPPAVSELRAARVTTAPDPRLEGRQVYSIAIQMPNITSYYGSWLVWFAERDRAAPTAAVDVRPPSPTRKVDPKYIPAAASERVEGVVRLFAVIRKDGSIDSVALIRHLDDRLDRSAVEALSKWEFEPALRAGVPIDVDAIFEIPFHLAPRTAK